MFPESTELHLDWLLDRINLDSKNPNQIHRHQKPICRHANQGKFHTWRMESLCCALFKMSAISVLQCVLKRWRKERKKNQEKNGSQQNRDQWWALLQGLPRICHRPRRQKAWRTDSCGNQESLEIQLQGERGAIGDDLISAQTKSKLPICYYHEQFMESFSSASCSKWDDDRAWSSQEWKTNTSMCDQPGLRCDLLEKDRSPNQVSFMKRLSTMEQRNPLWTR